MSKLMGVGVIGCGNISAAYFGLAPLFKGLEMRACADANPKAAKARAKQFGIKAQSVGNLLKNPDIDIIDVSTGQVDPAGSARVAGGASTDGNRPGPVLAGMSDFQRRGIRQLNDLVLRLRGLPGSNMHYVVLQIENQ